MSKIYIQEKLKGNSGQVVSFITDPEDSSKKKAIVKDAPINTLRSIILTVHAPDKQSRIVVTNGTFTYVSEGSYTEFVPEDVDNLTTSSDEYFYVAEDNDRTFYLPSLGTWVVAATKGGIQSQTSINIDSIGSYEVSISYFRAYIDVTYDMGATCTCSNGVVTYTASDTTGSYRFTVPEDGDWVVKSILSGSTPAMTTVHISNYDEIANVHLTSIQPNLNDNSWSVIQAVTIEGLASSYWSVGDCKEVVLNGTVGPRTFSNLSLFVELIGFDHNTSNESSSKSTLTFQLGKKDVTNFSRGNSNGTCIGLYNSSGFSMQLTSTNAGGWENSYMRTVLLPQIKSCLPSDLQACIKFVKKYTDNSSTTTHSAAVTVTATYDDIFLLSEYEVFATTTSSNTNEASAQERYAYYENGSKVRQRDSSATTNIWWLRSPSRSNTTYYCTVNTSGALASGSASSGTYMISPAFVIGG